MHWFEGRQWVELGRRMGFEEPGDRVNGGIPWQAGSGSEVHERGLGWRDRCRVISIKTVMEARAMGGIQGGAGGREVPREGRCPRTHGQGRVGAEAGGPPQCQTLLRSEVP